MKILIAADGSAHYADALTLLLNGTWTRESEFKVVTVCTFGKLTMSEAQSVNGIAVKALISQFGEVRVFSQVCEGDAAHHLLQAAHQWSADLIVLGAHRFTGLGRVLLGSVTDTLINQAECSVFVGRINPESVYEKEERNRQKVLVCINAQHDSDTVLNYIAMRPWPCQTQFMVVNVFEPPTEDYSPSPGRDLLLFQESEVKLQEEMGIFIDRSVEFLQQHLLGHKVFGVVREELDIAQDLASLSHEWQADLVIIGAPSRHGMFEESICRSVVLATRSAVLVVRHKS